MIVRSILCAAALGAAIAACAHDDGNNAPASSAGMANMQAGNTDWAVDRIAGARCDREASCGNVGQDKEYATRDACIDELRGSGRSDLRASDCPRGIDTTQLDKCLSEIRGEKCGNPIDTVTRIMACRTGDLCPK